MNPTIFKTGCYNHIVVTHEIYSTYYLDGKHLKDSRTAVQAKEIPHTQAFFLSGKKHLGTLEKCLLHDLFWGLTGLISRSSTPDSQLALCVCKALFKVPSAKPKF